MEEYGFDNCWVDKDMPLVTLKIGGTEFRMRAITAGEHQEIRARAQLSSQGAKSIEDAAVRQHDGYTVIIGDVAAALGAYKKIGNEGWSDPRPVTEENVRELHDQVLFILSNEANKFFRGEFGRPAELGASAAVVGGPGN